MADNDPSPIDPFASPSSPTVGGSSSGRSKIKTGRLSFPFNASAITALSSAFSNLRSQLQGVVSLLNQVKAAAPALTNMMNASGGAPTAGGGTSSYLPNNVMYGPSMRGVSGPLSGAMSYGQAAHMNALAAGSNAYNAAPGGYMSSAVAGVRAYGNAAMGGGNLGTAGKVGFGFFAGQQASQMASSLIAPVDDRITRGYTYSLAADKMTVLYQQMSGMSAEAIRSSYRTPLTQYRIGATGVNELMGMQAQTGLSALLQAGSVESLRTMSGYGLSGADAAQMVTSLADPSVVNRMFMMTGTSLIGPGGTENSAMSVIQRMSRLINVRDQRTGEAALRPGSITRARLSSFGLSPELQTQVIQYAMQNAQYRAKGGTGFLDYTNEAHRRLTGIEGSFATQAEETMRTKVQREEAFYNEQADNFADLERKTQALTKAFKALEDTLGGILGTKISNQPFGNIVGSVGTMVGSGLAAAGIASGNPLLALLGVGVSGVSGMLKTSGDAPQSASSGYTGSTSSTRRSANTSGLDPNMAIPGVGGTVAGLMKSQTFTKLHPTMQQRVLSVIRDAGGQVGIGEGYRSRSQQETMFLQRYRPTNRTNRGVRQSDSDMWYQGKWWEKKDPRAFDAAPPGMSFHEVGLAVDFAGNLGLASQIGKQYGLQTFENVNNELHHAQPVELPTSWDKYAKGGYAWGAPTEGGMEPGQGTSSVPGSSLTSGGRGGYTIGGVREVSTFQNMTLSQMIASDSMMAAGGFSAATDFNGTYTGVSSSSGLNIGQSTSTGALAGQLSAEQLVAVFQKNGFSGQDLAKAVGISWRESRWNPRAHNPVPPDNSYGLMQINMLDKPGYMLGDSRRKQFGISNEDLFNPDVNARVARALVGDGTGWSHWRPGDGKGGWLSETHGTDMAWAASVVSAVNAGQPAPAGRGDAPVTRSQPIASSPAYAAAMGQRSTTAVISNSDYNITIAPNITLSGGAHGADLQRLAKEVGDLLEKEVRRAMMRST